MDSHASKASFAFVNSTIINPSAPQDLAVRVLIRKQAMKQASAARRRDGSCLKHNQRQYPVFYKEPIERIPTNPTYCSPGKGSRTIRQQCCTVKDCRHVKSTNSQPAYKQQGETSNGKDLYDSQTWRRAILASPSRKGYELMTIKYGFDVLDLSSLISFHVGRATNQFLSVAPSQLLPLLQGQKWSYLSYLPSRYGDSLCMEDAVHCLLARVRHIIAPGSDLREATVLKLYIKALESLNKALDSPLERVKPEVLCATEILSLYELLDPTGNTAWIRHAAGAARLIQIRGPKHYSTDFEKALLVAHAGPIITESLLNNDRCFLAQAGWQEVLQSLILSDPAIADRSEIVISLHIQKSRISTLFTDIQALICSPGIIPNSNAANHSTIEKLTKQAQEQRDNILQWRDDHNVVLSPSLLHHDPVQNEPPTHQITYEKRCEITATYIVCLMMANRLLASLSLAQAPSLERETQEMARRLVELESEVQNAESQARLFMAQAIMVARAVLATGEEWADVDGRLERWDLGDGTGECIEGWKFERWCRLWGRVC